jgi:membrane peptidoglycan carboxypeptidase
VRVAGKTGTSQVVGLEHTDGLDEHEVMLRHRDHAWFVGYAPAEAPEVVVAAIVEHGGHGGSAAAPVVQKVLAAYFGVPPTPPAPPPQPARPASAPWLEAESAPVDDAAAQLAEAPDLEEFEGVEVEAAAPEDAGVRDAPPGDVDEQDAAAVPGARDAGD